MTAPTTGAQALLQLANDAARPLPERRAAAAQLLRQHALPGITLLGVALLLKGANWLADAHVRLVHDIGGRVLPVPAHLGGTVIAIDLLPGEGVWPKAFLRVPGTVARDDVAALLLGRAVPALAAVPVLDIGLLDA